MYEVVKATGQNMENLNPDDYVLDRPFILSVSYQDGRYVLLYLVLPFIERVVVALQHILPSYQF